MILTVFNSLLIALCIFLGIYALRLIFAVWKLYIGAYFDPLGRDDDPKITGKYPNSEEQYPMDRDIY